MKKLIISSLLLAAFGVANAQPYPDRFNERHDNRHGERHEQRENRMDVRGLEREAMQQKAKIDRAIYTRAISPEEANWVREGYNKVWNSIDRAKRDRRISDREIRRIEMDLRRNEQALERAMHDRRR